jgi:hypothetical protein
MACWCSEEGGDGGMVAVWKRRLLMIVAPRTTRIAY